MLGPENLQPSNNCQQSGNAMVALDHLRLLLCRHLTWRGTELANNMGANALLSPHHTAAAWTGCTLHPPPQQLEAMFPFQQAYSSTYIEQARDVKIIWQVMQAIWCPYSEIKPPKTMHT